MAFFVLLCVLDVCKIERGYLRGGSARCLLVLGVDARIRLLDAML